MADIRQALWQSGHDESVEVNQRALIDKVLARYSAEFTVFRELLQNSDDAQSRAVEIRFETQQYLDQKTQKEGDSDTAESRPLPDLKKAIVNQWTFKNNGIAFRDEDWDRLKKIAEGNPDEEKIGAFGVGFYSLFSVTEEPFVISGDRWMGFYWKDKKDQLFARRGQLPQTNESTPWTTFEMLLREPASIPVPFDFIRFLASSITFMTYLSEISVYFDHHCLAKLTKSSGLPKELGIPKGLKNTSPSGIMTVNNIKSTPLHIHAAIIQAVYKSGPEKKSKPPPIIKENKPSGQSFFSSLLSSTFLSSISGGSTPQRTVVPLPVTTEDAIDPLTIIESNVTLSIFLADVSARVDKKLGAELYRSTKKNPPTKLKYELIYTAKDEYDASREEDKRQHFETGSIFQGLRADLDGIGSARVFIGHATAQTTGLGGHISTRFIPTVEREAIDFMDRNVAVWNRELLYIGGFLARSAYEYELTAVKHHWEAQISSEPNEDIENLLKARSIHILKFFSFHPSTPSSEVSDQLEVAFFSCGKQNQFPLISTKGIRNSLDVRLPNPLFSGFLKQLPVLPSELVEENPLILGCLQTRRLLKEITFEDVLKELRSRPLSEDEMIACLKWWTSLYKDGDQSRLIPVRTELLNAAVFTAGTLGTKDEKIIPLTTIKAFINPRKPGGTVPLDGPLPDYLLPPNISKTMSPESIAAAFPWRELTIFDWLQYICSPAATAFNSEFDINSSATWAEQVLTFLARVWPTIPGTTKSELISLLSGKTCVPTSNGMRAPDQSYFASANIFNDLPVVTLPSGMLVKGSIERVLEALGVRKHVDLQVIFNRMIKTNEWTISDLTKYLVSVKTTLTTEELARLKVTAAFTKEASSKDPPDNLKPPRYQAKQLYEPLDVFRVLGLPVIDWGKQTKWRGSSEEARFLFELGLQRNPPLEKLIECCTSSDPEVRTTALKYLIDNLDTRYQNYNPLNFESVAFIPALNGDQFCLGTPKQVFSNKDWVVFGFLVIHPTIQHNAGKLKIAEYPPASQLVSFLEQKPPQSVAEAKSWFSILSGRVHDFSATELTKLSSIPLVPIKPASKVAGPTVRWIPPSQCYLGSGSTDGFHSKLFVFVDFGTAGNAFISACGAKHEPSVEEVAKILLDDPRNFYELAQGPTNFLAELRNIAVNSRLISSATLSRMKNSAILLSSQRKMRKNVESKDENDLDEDEWDVVYDLKKPGQIVVADDTHAYQTFGDSLYTAPQEDILESFYVLLGSKRLSSLVKEEYHTSAELTGSKLASETRTLVLQRLPLFLHEHTHAKTRVSHSWLSSENNFIVKAFGKLSVTKSLNFGDLHLSRKQDASAVAKRFGYGPIQLWLGGNGQIDMYEVATSLNRLLFETPKANDALLFMTILSTDIRALKRRGYNVERILKQQRAEKQAIEDAKVKDAKIALATKPLDGYPGEKPSTLTAKDAPTKDKHDPDIPGGFHKPTSPQSFINSVRRKIGSSINHKAQGNNTPLSTNTEQNPSSSSHNSKLDSKQTVTPLSNISANIEMAIKACRPESGSMLRNRQEMNRVKESLDEGYCDITGQVGNLKMIGEISHLKVFLTEDVPQAHSFLQVKSNSLFRFCMIITSLAKVYELPLSSLHVFYDLESGLIAFNRNGSVFLSLRYYEAWHDTEVQSGKVDSAYISWYFTLAHEIAHNLVLPHNSEHEFYFSGICEKYIMSLGRLLSSNSNLTT